MRFILMLAVAGVLACSIRAEALDYLDWTTIAFSGVIDESGTGWQASGLSVGDGWWGTIHYDPTNLYIDGQCCRRAADFQLSAGTRTWFTFLDAGLDVHFSGSATGFEIDGETYHSIMSAAWDGGAGAVRIHSYEGAGDDFVGTIRAVPEPTTWLLTLMGVAIATLAAAAARRPVCRSPSRRSATRRAG